MICVEASSQCLADNDSDGIPDSVDNCPSICNSAQLNADWTSDSLGDVCDDTPGCGGCSTPDCEVNCDLDFDSILNTEDNCPDHCNTQQLDADGDQIGDVCDTEGDGPGCGGCAQDPCEQEC